MVENAEDLMPYTNVEIRSRATKAAAVCSLIGVPALASGHYGTGSLLAVSSILISVVARNPNLYHPVSREFMTTGYAALRTAGVGARVVGHAAHAAGISLKAAFRGVAATIVGTVAAGAGALAVNELAPKAIELIPHAGEGISGPFAAWTTGTLAMGLISCGTGKLAINVLTGKLVVPEFSTLQSNVKSLKGSVSKTVAIARKIPQDVKQFRAALRPDNDNTGNLPPAPTLAA
jgi:hypothetical protein